MPRKRWRTRASVYDPDLDPNAKKDDRRVRQALHGFAELDVLPEQTREQLAADLVTAIRHARCGVSVGKRGMSDNALAQQIFLSDVGRALERAGLPAKRWRKRYDDGDGPSDDAPESFFFRLAREVGEVSGIPLPCDLKLPGIRASRHQYGAMSPSMKTAQDEELAAQRQRPSKPDEP